MTTPPTADSESASEPTPEQPSEPAERRSRVPLLLTVLALLGVTLGLVWQSRRPVTRPFKEALPVEFRELVQGSGMVIVEQDRASESIRLIPAGLDGSRVSPGSILIDEIEAEPGRLTVTGLVAVDVGRDPPRSVTMVLRKGERPVADARAEADELGDWSAALTATADALRGATPEAAKAKLNLSVLVEAGDGVLHRRVLPIVVDPEALKVALGAAASGD